nr:retrotransposon protein, putative, Ty1-copia subclass [Tanacetum cinerariifolium]
MTTSSTNNSIFRSFFEKQKLTGPNFIDWYRQLRIVLSIEDKLHHLEQPIPPVPEAPEGQQVAPEVLEAYYAWIKRDSWPHAHDMGNTVNELHAMLKLHEQTLTLPKSNAPALHDIQAGKVQKGHWKRNYPRYLAELMKKKKNTASGAGGSAFQKELENQLGKTIKSLRLDRGGEYMSQEFLDHLKDHGIIAHRTPPYTPQHNGVSERRNRTLLDMVRSMTSQTTLPKSFWDYALETAAHILNMSQGASAPTEKQRMQDVSYALAIGSIMYDVRCTRPDVAFTHNITSRFQHNTGKEHWIAVKHILRYLRNTKDMFLVYGGNMERELIVSCYIDAGYLTDADDLKS